MSTPEQETRRYVGKLKSVGGMYGFITCPELSETYTRDVYVTHGDYAGKWEVGTSVSFTVAVNDKGKPQARDVQQIDGDHREIVVDTSSDQNLDQNYTSSPAGTGFVTPLSQPQMPATPLSQPQMPATPASSQLPMTPASQQPTPAATAPQRTRLPSSSWADMVDDDEEVLSDGQTEPEPVMPMPAEPEIPVEPTPATCDSPKKASTLVQEFNLDPNLAGFVLLDALETAIAENQPETMEGPPAQSEVVHAPTQTELKQQGNRFLSLPLTALSFGSTETMDQIDQIERTPDAFEGEVASCLGFSMGAQEQKEEPQLPPPAAPQASESRSQGERRVSSAQAIAGRVKAALVETQEARKNLLGPPPLDDAPEKPRWPSRIQARRMTREVQHEQLQWHQQQGLWPETLNRGPRPPNVPPPAVLQEPPGPPPDPNKKRLSATAPVFQPGQSWQLETGQQGQSAMPLPVQSQAPSPQPMPNRQKQPSGPLGPPGPARPPTRDNRSPPQGFQMQGQGPQQELRPRPEAHYKGAGPHWEGPHGPQEHYPQYQGRPAHYQAQQAPHLSPAQGPGAYPPSRWPDEVPERAREGREGREGQGKRRGNDPAGGTWGATGRNGLPVAENWEVEAKRHWPGPRPQERWEEGQWEGWEEEGGGNWADWEPQRGNWTNKNWNEWRGWEEREWSGRSHEGKGKEKGKKQQRPPMRARKGSDEVTVISSTSSSSSDTPSPPPQDRSNGGKGNGRAPRAALRRMYQEQREAERGNGNGNPGKRREQDHRRQRGWQSK
eukprot:s149_g13.t1